MLGTSNRICSVMLGLAVVAWSSTGWGQEVKHYRFAYDQPKGTGYGVAGDIFADKLK